VIRSNVLGEFQNSDITHNHDSCSEVTRIQTCAIQVHLRNTKFDLKSPIMTSLGLILADPS